MAKKFNTYVNVHKDPAEYVSFAPGDEVPDWALDLVGDHVYTDADETDVRLTDPHYEEDEDATKWQSVNTLPDAVDKDYSEDIEEDEEVDYSSLKKDELVKLAEKRELDASGTKAEIIERLEADDAEEDDE